VSICGQKSKLEFQDWRNQPLCHLSGNFFFASRELVPVTSRFFPKRSPSFPIGTVPTEKFLEPINITPVKIDKILSFTAGHLARIRRRTGFDIV
jgi:hypothetical protein